MASQPTHQLSSAERLSARDRAGAGQALGARGASAAPRAASSSQANTTKTIKKRINGMSCPICGQTKPVDRTSTRWREGVRVRAYYCNSCRVHFRTKEVLDAIEGMAASQTREE